MKKIMKRLLTKVAEHKDIEDDGQTVTITERIITMHTTATDKATGKKTIEAGKDVTIVDTVTLDGLEKGVKYQLKERPTTVKREQSQSTRAKEPVTKQQEVRTQVARESSSPAVTPKHSGTVTDMPRQTVKHQKQKKTTNPSTMKKTTSRKGGKK